MNLILRKLHYNREKIFYFFIITSTVFFLSNALVLSNYGAILEFLAIPDSRPLFGTPILIPGLDLEAYIYTPEFQILVNNGFERFNHTSPFNEDLKSLYSLPILDWGLIFKPNLWAFFIVPPEYAFSFFHLTTIALFISGYYKLGRLLGASAFYSIVFSLGLFFSGFVQVWWILFGVLLALFPWIMLLITSQINNLLKWTLLYYTLTCWLISNFYPPLIITLGFAGALLYIAIEKEFYKKPSSFVILLVVAAASLATAFLYLEDPINAIKNSVYPGNRIASGGSDFPAVLWLNQIFPTLLQAGSRSLISVEMAEAAAMTSLFALVLVFFKDFKNFFSPQHSETRRSIAIFFIGTLFIWAWMLLPLPSWIGRIFLWDHVQPRRLVVGSGLLIFAICCSLISKFPWKMTFVRCVIFSLVILLPWIAYKSSAEVSIKYKLIDLLPVISCFLIFLINKIKTYKYIFELFVLIVLLLNLVIFGRLNSIQSAKPIFQTKSSAALEAIEEVAENSPDRIVALERFEGSVLNGLGFRSAGHALLTPQPQVYRRFFPEMSEIDFNSVFNRTASIRVFYGISPNSGGLGVNVPIENFGSNLEIRKVIHVTNSSYVPKHKEIGGEFLVINKNLTKIAVQGWARWSGINKNQILYVYSPFNLENISMKYTVNGRGGEHLLSSFHLSFDVPNKLAASEEIPICLFSVDTKFGVYLLENRESKYDCVKELAVNHSGNSN